MQKTLALSLVALFSLCVASQTVLASSLSTQPESSFSGNHGTGGSGGGSKK